MSTLISFDVDGTLITSVGNHANRLHKLAFAAAWKEVFNLDADIDAIKHHGSTDPLILLRILEHHGISKEAGMERLKDMEQIMCQYFGQHQQRAGEGIELLPGVMELLVKLRERGDVATCLVTGNLEPIGWAKMAALGLRDHFSSPHFGGFGSDFCSGDTLNSWRDRAELVRIAAKRAEESVGTIGARFHVGDTPMDLQAAAEAGAQAIGVTTGIYSRQELEATGVDAIILENLADLEAVFRAFNLA
ncbi:hypothetical protein WJX72_008333 [[Myrmecia] bisecta]|uniref:Haloacid dehalogenase n=1 Tax=[Myrmecia] bisecta TaxID=41462 RepID=A0AAW1R7V3_9CHLO